MSVVSPASGGLPGGLARCPFGSQEGKNPLGFQRHLVARGPRSVHSLTCVTSGLGRGDIGGTLGCKAGIVCKDALRDMECETMRGIASGRFAIEPGRAGGLLGGP